MEAAGISTISLSMIPDFTHSVGAPRVAAIAYPLARPLGQPGDRDGQLAVLRTTLQALVAAEQPGAVIELPFVWPEPVARARAASEPQQPPPIVGLLANHPWLFTKLLSGDIPERAG